MFSHKKILRSIPDMVWGHLRKAGITIFVILWCGLFHYVSLRHFYLEPLMGRPLPQPKFLFPPAGWIMFFHVGNGFSHLEILGMHQGRSYRIEPHAILPTRYLGFDNVHRGVLGSAADPQHQRPFCRYLRRKFPEYDDFLITAVSYPPVREPLTDRRWAVLYQCRVFDP
jgi:hypothetical protein